MGKKKDPGFCPLLSKERKDGMINKVDCDEGCALHSGYGCGLLQQSSLVDGRIDRIGLAIERIEKLLKGNSSS